MIQIQGKNLNKQQQYWMMYSSGNLLKATWPTYWDTPVHVQALLTIVSLFKKILCIWASVMCIIQSAGDLNRIKVRVRENVLTLPVFEQLGHQSAPVFRAYTASNPGSQAFRVQILGLLNFHYCRNHFLIILPCSLIFSLFLSLLLSVLFLCRTLTISIQRDSREQNLKDETLVNWLNDSGIRCLIWLDLNILMTISRSKENPNSPWCDVVIEIWYLHWISLINCLSETRSWVTMNMTFLKIFWKLKNIMRLAGCSYCCDKWWQKTMSSGFDCQLKCYINDLKASKHAVKESLISCSYRAEASENQMLNLIILLVELQCKLTPSLRGVHC